MDEGTTMPKALIVYATRTGETRHIADLIAEGLRFSGHEAEVVEAKNIKNEADLGLVEKKIHHLIEMLQKGIE